jgi:hypothetical protein
MHSQLIHHTFNSARAMRKEAEDEAARGSAKRLAEQAAALQAQIDSDLGLSGHTGFFSNSGSTFKSRSALLGDTGPSSKTASLTPSGSCKALADTASPRQPHVQLLAVYPEQLRPAPFDSMRLMYLEHQRVCVRVITSKSSSGVCGGCLFSGWSRSHTQCCSFGTPQLHDCSC